MAHRPESYRESNTLVRSAARLGIGIYTGLEHSSASSPKRWAPLTNFTSNDQHNYLNSDSNNRVVLTGRDRADTWRSTWTWIGHFSPN